MARKRLNIYDPAITIHGVADVENVRQNAIAIQGVADVQEAR
jgi:hypothetical protein